MENQKYDVAAYIWPAFTGDEPRARIFWPEGIGEWQSVKNAVKKAPDHDWPRKPLWGFVNEADPYVMEMEINAAADHGVNVFIYDWYWFDHRPFLEQCLNNGYLHARNNGRVKFYLMWANHTFTTLCDIRTSDPEIPIWDGAVGRGEFERIALRMIRKYFRLANYYTISGKPVLMIYDVPNLIRGLGGLKQTRAALDWFREQAVLAGLSGLHLQMVLWNEMPITVCEGGENHKVSVYKVVSELGFDSITNYQMASIAYPVNGRDYGVQIDLARKAWKSIDSHSPVPYFPHVSIGWDNNPRFLKYRPNILRGNTPEKVEQALRMAKAYADVHLAQSSLITLNSWNEWTESSYLEPDDINDYAFLDAVKRVFL